MTTEVNNMTAAAFFPLLLVPDKERYETQSVLLRVDRNRGHSVRFVRHQDRKK